MTGHMIVAEVVRNGFVEGHHYGSVVVTAPDGAVEWSAGVVDRPMFPRSCHKLAQAVGMLRVGLDLDGELLALAAASHSGEPFHLDGVRRILTGAGLAPSALRTPPAYPMDERAHHDWLRAGHGPEPLAMNCSGKHAAMLATCVGNGWPTDGYRDPDHPVQRAVRAAIEDTAGESAAAVAVDGCGAPLFAISLAGLARAFGWFGAAAPSTPEGRVAAAFRAHPEWASGTRRDEAALIRATPGLVCKGGAEAVFAVGLADGRGLAVKIDDGGPRARRVVTAATLSRLGLDNAVIREQCASPVLGGGEPVGAVRPSPELTAALAHLPVGAASCRDRSAARRVGR
jgi:L-asparaginase II